MNGKASELYSWGPPKLKSELRLLQKNACSENQISWIFGLFLKMRLSENPTTEIRRSQGPGVNRKKTVVVPNKFFMLEIRL